jgi:thymidylate synthase (FAD)
MRVTYLDHMGSDLTVVNAARVSFGKRVETFSEKDARLITYLAKHKHMLPFRHPQVSMHWKAPIFVARQLVKHQVGMSWSEISRRYVTNEPEFWFPSEWRAAADNVKQGSDPTKLITHYGDGEGYVVFPDVKAANVCRRAAEVYVDMLAAGVAPEQARMLLPQNLYTEWVWTGSLLSWAHLWQLRVEHSAQQETQELVKQIEPIMQTHFPVSWAALTNAGGES